jgi:hypothetical protein
MKWETYKREVFKAIIPSFNGTEGNYTDTIYFNGVSYKIHTGPIIVKSHQLACILLLYNVQHTKKAFVF